MKINPCALHGYALLPKSAASYLHIAKEAELKVLLYVLTAPEGTEIEPRVFQHLGITQEEFVSAVKFWVEKNVLPKDLLATDRVQQKKAAVDITTMPTYTPIQVSIEMESSSILRSLYQEAERTLGKTLSSSDITTLYGLYDWLKLPPEVILLLLSFCAMQGKKSMKYVEKTAIEWAKEGISSLESAEQYIASFQQRKDYQHHVKQLLQISGRELTPKERGFVQKWEAQNFSDELLLLAYEKTVANTGKVAFAYMNTILMNWAEKGYTTPEQVGSERQPQKAAPKQSSRFDFDEFERRSFEIIKQQTGGK